MTSVKRLIYYVQTLGKSSLFADDVTDSVHSSEIGIIEKELQGRISDVEEWCVANLMVLSVEKTKVMLMGGKHKLNSIPNSTNCLNIKAQDRKIEQVQNERLLGVQIDNHLSWDEQVKKVKRTCLFKLSLLRKIRNYLPLNVRKMFFNYYIKPHLDYCNTVWGKTSKGNLDTLNRIQKQAARLILDKDYTTPSEHLFRELSLLNFADSVKYQEAVLVYKSLNGQAPPYMREMFQYVENNNLRSCSNKQLFIPRVHQKSIRFSGPKTWNNLNLNIREAKSISQFKKRLIKNSLSKVTQC